MKEELSYLKYKVHKQRYCYGINQGLIHGGG